MLLSCINQYQLCWWQYLIPRRTFILHTYLFTKWKKNVQCFTWIYNSIFRYKISFSIYRLNNNLSVKNPLRFSKLNDLSQSVHFTRRRQCLIEYFYFVTSYKYSTYSTFTNRNNSISLTSKMDKNIIHVYGFIFLS